MARSRRTKVPVEEKTRLVLAVLANEMTCAEAARRCGVTTATSVQRALRRRGLLRPHGFRADRKPWAVLRRRVFRDPPTERNRAWQTDFSESETTNGGIWRIYAVIDYATKYCLAALTPCTACNWPSP